MTLIDREEAIEELIKAQLSADYCKEHRIDSCIDLGMMCIVLHRLPSVQQTQEIIHCKDCKHHWTHKCMDSPPIEICDLKQTFYDAEVDFCSLGKRRDEGE